MVLAATASPNSAPAPCRRSWMTRAVGLVKFTTPPGPAASHRLAIAHGPANAGPATATITAKTPTRIVRMTRHLREVVASSCHGYGRACNAFSYPRSRRLVPPPALRPAASASPPRSQLLLQRTHQPPHFGVAIAARADDPHRVQHRRMISAVSLADERERQAQYLPQEIHCELPCEHDARIATR